MTSTYMRETSTEYYIITPKQICMIRVSVLNHYCLSTKNYAAAGRMFKVQDSDNKSGST